MRTTRWPALPLVVVVFAAGCGDDATTATTEPGSTSATTAGDTTEVTTTTAAAASTTAGAGASETLDLDDLSIYLEPEGLSYRTALDFHFFTDTPSTVEGRMLAEGGHVVGPPEVIDLVARAEGSATPPTCFPFTQSPGFLDPYDTFLEDGGMLMGEASLLEAGVESNGRVVDRYEITIDNIDRTDDAGRDVDELDSGYIDIDQERGFVVELFLTGRGRSDLLSGSSILVGDIDYRLEYSEFGTITELLTVGFC